MRVLVTGGAGFVGSIVVEQLLEHGHSVIVLDNLSHGHRGAVHPDAEFVEHDLLDGGMLVELLGNSSVDAVMHLAAEASIEESVRNPEQFFRVNTVGGLNLLKAMTSAGCRRIIFSSTAAVYGMPKQIPIPEDATKQPTSPYGESKLAFERMLRWFESAHGIKHISLRYFNACGASEKYGEDHVPESHLIPVLFEVALGRRPCVFLHGEDYDTPDGTCIRDYVHVEDIAQAHLLALTKIDDLSVRAYNVGLGRGYSNGEVIQAVSRVTGRTIAVTSAGRRAGDPAQLVADARQIRRELEWQPRFPNLNGMVETAWRWRLAHPSGYS